MVFLSKASLLSAGKVLVRLDLSDNPMTAEVAPALGESIRRHPKLRVLNLNDTALSDEGVSAIAEALSDSPAEIEVRVVDTSTSRASVQETFLDEVQPKLDALTSS